MARTLEAKLKTAIREAIEARGGWARLIVATGFGKPDIDIHACYLGQFIGIEAKIAPRKPTPMQKKTLDDIDRAFGWTCVAYSVEDVLIVLDNIEQSR